MAIIKLLKLIVFLLQLLQTYMPQCETIKLYFLKKFYDPHLSFSLKLQKMDKLWKGWWFLGKWTMLEEKILVLFISDANLCQWSMTIQICLSIRILRTRKRKCFLNRVWNILKLFHSNNFNSLNINVKQGMVM